MLLLLLAAVEACAAGGSAGPRPAPVLVAQAPPARASVTTMAFSPTGESLAFGSRDDSLHLWRIGDADEIGRVHV